MVPHRGVVNYLTWCQRSYPLGEGAGAPVHSSISFDLTVTSLWAPLASGRPVHLLPEDPDGAEPLGVALRRQGDYSLVKITPAHLEVVAQRLGGEAAAGRTRALVLGGENLSGESLAFWRKWAPETRLINEYGPTETVVGCCVHEVRPGDDLPGGVVPIGRPILNTRLYVLDGQMEPVPVGVPGELYVGGVGVARGYWNRPGVTAERFVPDPFSGAVGARLYRTGDVARYRPDGTLECLGRTDHQVKIRGFRVELGEVEAVLGEHAAVREAVAAVHDEGTGQRQLVGYVVAEAESTLAVGDLRAYMQARVPDYMVPAVFVELAALPLTPNGKVDRRALPAPDERRLGPDSAYEAPRTGSEEILAQLWADVLGVERVGVHDNFFELGGDSILDGGGASRRRRQLERGACGAGHH
jgi:acyl-coenzyme A synthetase/AMP-(fatty) acid ligase